MTLGHQAKMDPSDLILELSKFTNFASLTFRLVHVSSFGSMIPRPVGLWTLSLEKLLGFNGSNQSKGKYLGDPCNK